MMPLARDEELRREIKQKKEKLARLKKYRPAGPVPGAGGFFNVGLQTVVNRHKQEVGWLEDDIKELEDELEACS